MARQHHVVYPITGSIHTNGLSVERVGKQSFTEEDTLTNGEKGNDTSKTDKRKQSLYFPESMLQEIKEEAARLDRSLSWVVQRAWKISRLEIKKLPSVNEVDGDDDDEA
jgi:uncharacterized small protein (TIGR04563 family)